MLLLTSRKNILEGKEENIFEFTQDMQGEETCRFALYIIHTDADPNGKKFEQLFFSFYTAYKGVNFYVKLQQQFEINTFFHKQIIL